MEIEISDRYFEEWAGADVLMIGDVAKKLSTSFVRDNVGFLREVSVTTILLRYYQLNVSSAIPEPLRNFLARTR